MWLVTFSWGWGLLTILQIIQKVLVKILWMYLLLLCDVCKTLEGGIKNICANANSFIQKKWECFSRKWIHAFLKFLSNARTYFTYKMICSDKRIIGIISICRNKNKLTSNKFTTLWTIWQLWPISIERLIGTFKVSTVKTKHSCEYYYVHACLQNDGSFFAFAPTF